MIYMKYKLVNYFDVWYEGDGEDGGWQVNNLCTEPDDVTVSGNEDQDYINALIDRDFLQDHVTTESMEVSNDGYMIEMFSKISEPYGMPICRLEPIEEEDYTL
jgi:hypothetical protein